MMGRGRTVMVQRYLEEASRLPSAQGVRAQDVLDNLPEYLSSLSALSRGQQGDPGHLKRRLEETRERARRTGRRSPSRTAY